MTKIVSANNPIEETYHNGLYNEENRNKVQLPSGSVRFFAMNLPSNCGVTFIYGVEFVVDDFDYKSLWEVATDLKVMGPVRERASRLMAEFSNYLKRGSPRNKIMISDSTYNYQVQYSKSLHNINMMCTQEGWIKGRETFNHNSGNKVVTFETDYAGPAAHDRGIDVEPIPAFTDKPAPKVKAPKSPKQYVNQHMGSPITTTKVDIERQWRSWQQTVRGV